MAKQIFPQNHVFVQENLILTLWGRRCQFFELRPETFKASFFVTEKELLLSDNEFCWVYRFKFLLPFFIQTQLIIDIEGFVLSLFELSKKKITFLISSSCSKSIFWFFLNAGIKHRYCSIQRKSLLFMFFSHEVDWIFGDYFPKLLYLFFLGRWKVSLLTSGKRALKFYSLFIYWKVESKLPSDYCNFSYIYYDNDSKSEV